MPLIEEEHRLKQPNVSPDQYQVKDDLVKQTRYSSVHAGGSGPKIGLIVNINPGPGEYKEGNSIFEIA